MSPTMTSFLIGVGIGAAVSAVGAFLSYWFGLRRSAGRSAVPLVYLLLAVQLLGIIGAISLVMGFITGTIAQDFATGLGVVFGFSLVFALLIFGYLKMNRN